LGQVFTKISPKTSFWSRVQQITAAVIGGFGVVQLFWQATYSDPMFPWLAAKWKQLKMPATSFSWVPGCSAILVAAAIFWFDKRQSQRKSLAESKKVFDLSLSEAGELFGKKTVQLVIKNIDVSPAQNVKVELISLRPKPKDLDESKFPIVVGDEKYTLNPMVDIRVPLFTVDPSRDGTKLAFSESLGFQESQYSMIESVASEVWNYEYNRKNPKSNGGDRAYSLSVRISALDRTPVERTVRIRLLPHGLLAPCSDFISLQADESKKSRPGFIRKLLRRS